VLRILGIDPGSRVTGYAVIEASADPAPRLRYVECGTVEADKDEPLEKRLGEIARGLAEVVRELAPQVAAMEDVFFGKNVRSMVALAQARGAALVACDLAGLAVSAYPPATIKQAVTGRGRAAKPQVSAMVRGLLGMRGVPRADATDALAVAIAHAMLRHSRMGALLAGARS
jgi:crossover junction endodeoxyribonuclease RuvC